MFTLDELIELKNGMDARARDLEKTLEEDCEVGSKTMNIIIYKLSRVDALIKKVDVLIESRSFTIS